MVSTPGIAGSPGVLTGPMGAPMDCCTGDGCCSTDGCCTPGCCDGSCCGGCCGWGNCCGDGCCFGNRWAVSAEYLLWFIRGQQLPPLLTTGSAADAIPGALGQQGTSVLFGNNSLANNPYSGLRLRGVWWGNDCHGWGIDLGGFFLDGNNSSYTNSSSGVPILTRPFVNALTGQEVVEQIANPAGLSAFNGIGTAGTFSAVSTFFLYGAEANLRRNFFCGSNWFIDGFAGWRMLGLNESLSMQESVTITAPPVTVTPQGNILAGTTDIVRDRFATSNLFNGAQIGGVGEYRLGRWIFDVRTSIALGGTQEVVNISGSTTSIVPGAMPTTLPGGLLTQSSNIGSHTRGIVSFVEEVGANVGYQFTNHIRGFIGYNFLYWSNVVRPGTSIDSVVNPNLLPGAPPSSPATIGPSRPAFSFNGTDFWAQGLTFGIDFRW
jgi:hypothetical protein